MSTPFSYFDLIEAFSKSGCAICNLLVRDAERQISSTLYEYSMETEIQNVFRAARGLCNEHGWQLTNYRGGVLNITVLYSAALDEILSIIEKSPTGQNASWLNRLRSSGEFGSPLANSLEPTASCPICEAQVESEKFYLQTFGQYIGDKRLLDAFRASDGLCLPHFRRALSYTRSDDDNKKVINIQTAIWKKLQADLEALKDMHDANRAETTSGDENDSWRRAIRLLSGEKGVFGKR